MSPFHLPIAATFLLLLLSPPTTTTGAATTTTVRDLDGHPLKPNTNYYILPVIRGMGGGLTMTSKNRTMPCPLYVGQDNHEVNRGLPVKFLPVDPKSNLISLSSDLNFVFDVATFCVQSTTWRLTLDEVTGRRHVGTGGEIGDPGVKTVSNWFKIEKDGKGKYDYKLVFCPSVCNFCKVMCGDLGVFIEDDGRRLLGFNDQPLLVMFKKA